MVKSPPMILFTLILFAFWIILSGKFDLFHLALGFLSSLGVSLVTRKLVILRPPVVGILPPTLHRWPLYLPWLMWQILLSAVQVARVVLHPKMPINPRLIRFKCGLPNPLAHVTLANSITLTPGTVTLDVAEEEYTVHALTAGAADSLVPAKGEGEMQERVARLFGTEPERK